ncbi:MAG TPA: topoisomerase IV [Candidatus Merdivicinus excrementipullorum]|uniref:Topoisomerase IV n=1 Tax=Candidatus Merdivicinus excrementipullorum TaxID=2840867 RepID=A0A9D1K0R7_9FIRM|nr:topoisomerase IV [Candidatus Merdivicinus excrementipullorum]
MPKKQKETPKTALETAYIKDAGLVVQQPITETLMENYMPYAMSVIVSRALPEIDGFKPAHRKLLYTMYLMGLLNGPRTKSANVVGQTMKLNPHGDQTIYETMVRLARGNESLLHPYVDSKGNFGKAYSRDMAYAASRYTEVKLEKIAGELFKDIGKDTVDFVPNYDNTMTEPTLFPATFPSILVNSNVGIAVSMASSICPFNLAEVCETTVQLLKNPDFDVTETLKGPDFPGGGYLILNPEEFRKVCETGRGSLRIRGRYQYDKSANCIEITEIPPTTTVEVIIDKMIDLVKSGKVREISDIRDETDLSGLKIAVELKRGADPDKLMNRLFKMTPLEDTYSCNFNVLIDGVPKVLGAKGILLEWINFRQNCVARRVKFDLKKAQDKLHLLQGLGKILLDIDKAIHIVRETEDEEEVVPNLMMGFGIDEIQAEYVAEIKLRHLNRQYILDRLTETKDLENAIAEMQDILESPRKIKKIIITELQEVSRKYGQPRKTLFLYADETDDGGEEEEIPDYPVHLFVTAEGYFKKILPQSLRMSGAQKLKEGDEIRVEVESTNRAELLFFTDKCQVYKAKASDFTETKASVMGDYIPSRLGFDEGERLVETVITLDYKGDVLFFFENGKVSKVPLSAYETKTNRRKLQKAYSDKSPLLAVSVPQEGQEYILTSSQKRKLIFNPAMIAVKATRDNQGVAVMTLKKNGFVEKVETLTEQSFVNPNRYRTKTLPAAGGIVREEDLGEQLTLAGE